MKLQRRDLFRATVAGFLAKMLPEKMVTPAVAIVEGVAKVWVSGWAFSWDGDMPPWHANCRSTLIGAHEPAIVKETWIKDCDQSV